MIGSMRNRVKIQTESAAADTGGGYVNTWTDVATMWCSIEPVSGSEGIQAQGLAGKISHKVMTRFRSDVTTGDRLLWGSRAFNVRAVLNTNERSRFITILAEEGVAI